MTTRTADEAEIMSDDDQRVSTRAKTSNDTPATAEDHAATTKALDLLSYIPPPPVELLHIHGWNPSSITDNQSREQVALWDAETGAKVLVYKANGGRIDSRDEITKLRDIIQNTLGSGPSPIIAAPIPEVERGRRDGSPVCSLVRGILPDKVQLLINMRFISTATLSVFFIPYSPPPYQFVTTLKGFMFFDEKEKESEKEVREIVGEALFSMTTSSDSTKTIRRFLGRHQDNIPKPIESMETTLRYLRSSIVIRRFNLLKKEDVGTGAGESYPAWNVYIQPPTTIPSALDEWRAAIQSFTFVTKEDGAGRTYKIFKCTVCRSSDHPGGLCPYPPHPKWASPTTTTSLAAESLLNPPQQQNDNRNPATRGRGRGTASNQRGRSNAAPGRRGNPRN